LEGWSDYGNLNIIVVGPGSLFRSVGSWTYNKPEPFRNKFTKGVILKNWIKYISALYVIRKSMIYFPIGEYLHSENDNTKYIWFERQYCCLQLQKHIDEEVSTWNGMEVHINGLPFSEYTQLQWEEHELRKELDKNRRVCNILL